MAKSEVPMTAPDGCTFWLDGHLCDRTDDHCGQCMCKCGHRWTREQSSHPHGLTLHLPVLDSALEDELISFLRRRIGEGGVSA